MFLLCDHFIWLHRAKVINVDVEGWNELSNRWWLYGDIMNLARDIYEVRKEGSFLLENKPLLVDLVKNLVDIILPLTALGALNSPLHPPHSCLRILEGSSNCSISGHRFLYSWHRPNAQPQASPLVVVPELSPTPCDTCDTCLVIIHAFHTSISALSADDNVGQIKSSHLRPL